MNPSAVRVYVPSTGVRADCNAAVALVLELPDAYPERVVEIVATEAWPADNPEIVTTPVFEIEIVAPLVAVPDHVY